VLLGDERAISEYEGFLDEAGLTFGAAFVFAVRRKFSPDSDVREISRWVARLRDALLEADVHIRPRESEALVRAVLGEGHLAGRLTGEEMGDTVVALLPEMVRDLRLSPADVDLLVQEAEELVAEHEERGVVS
jgi:hypothetical protein